MQTPDTQHGRASAGPHHKGPPPPPEASPGICYIKLRKVKIIPSL
jgi:hypothetical protein